MPLAAGTPHDELLAAGLRTVLCRGTLTVEHRCANAYESTFPSEIVTCRLDDGSRIRLFCKYGVSEYTSGFGHRRGVALEAAVYRDILSETSLTSPRFYGAHDGGRGSTWLVLGYLDDSERLNHSPDSEAALSRAARWSAEFHAAGRAALSRRSVRAALVEYDEPYYLGWAGRATSAWKTSAAPARGFVELRAHYLAAIPRLLDAAKTVIHGEFVPANILLAEASVYPVDWESAAIAPGEIDLAALTYRWPDHLSMPARRVYEQARLADGWAAEADVFAAARLYWVFRWLGDRGSQKLDGRGKRFFEGHLSSFSS
ncbi:MAG: phosphotransferase [Gaiellaceae bacterium]